MGAAHTTMSTLPPLPRIRARRPARSRSPTSRASTTDVRAAVSYSNRHSSFSLSSTPQQRHNSSRSAYEIAQVLSTARRRGGTAARGPATVNQRSPHQVAKGLHRDPPGVPRRRRTAGPPLRENSRHKLRVEFSYRLVAAHRLDKRIEGLAVSAASLRGEVTVSEEGLHHPHHRQHMVHRVIRLRRRGWEETDNRTHRPEYRPPVPHPRAIPGFYTPKNGKTPNLQRLGAPMGVLVPETLTAAPGPVHPIPAHHPPDIARANRPVWGSIAGIPQGSRARALRVMPGQEVPRWCGYFRYPPNTCKTGFEDEPIRRQERFCPPSCWYRVVWFVCWEGCLVRCWFRRAGVVLLVLMLAGGLVGVDRSVAADTAGGGGVVASGGFSDVGGGVHQGGIDALEAEGVFEGTGCGDGLFCPDDPIHRWVMAVWMIRVLDDMDPAGSGSSRFADVDAGVWWAPYVERLAELEVTAGCATGPLRFCPDEAVTRGQMATFLVRAFGLEDAAAAGFADTGGGTHASSIDALAAAGVTAGCATEPLRFCPGDPVTRGQMATFVARAVGLVELPAPPPEDDPVPVPNGFVAIDGRERTSCGIRVDGTIACWGGEPPPEGAFIDLAVGRGHSCGLRADGTIACWGSEAPPEGAFIDLAAGGAHSCGLRADGRVACWGGNKYGQADPPEGRFVTLAAGAIFSCGIRVDGTIACWGYNQHGQADPPEGRFVTLAAGNEVSCAVRVGGGVECWGREGPARPVLDVPEEPLTVATASGSAEWGHGCGLGADGSVVCWGRNGFGEGDPPEGRFVDIATGSSVSCGLRAGGTIECWGSGQADDPPEGQFTSVSLNAGYGCGLRVGGTVECWGYNIWGRTRAPDGQFSAVSAGPHHPCGLRTDGTVVCWGGNTTGRVSAPGGRFTDVAVGWGRACGLRADGTLLCWRGSSPTVEPTIEADTPGGTFTDVVVGDNHSCGLRTGGTVTCWGINGRAPADPPEGRFADIFGSRDYSCGIRVGGNIECWGYRTVFEPPDRHFTNVAVGGHSDDYACGLRTDGTVECWGDTGGFAGVPARRFTDLFAAAYFLCGLRPDGSVVCWGDTRWIGAFLGASTGRFTAVSAGTDYTCGLRIDRTLSCWGRLGYEWRLAYPHPPGTFSDVSTSGNQACAVSDNGSISCWGISFSLPYNVPAGRFSHVSVGSGFSCGILADSIQGARRGEAPEVLSNRIACWGSNSDGKSTPPRPDGYRIWGLWGHHPYLRISAESYSVVSAGRGHGCGLRPDQTIDCWGSDTHGQATPPAGTFTDIAADRDHTCGIRTDGTVQCWGSNSYGESDPPPGRFVDIAAGGYFSCGIRTDGTALCWGRETATHEIYQSVDLTTPGGRFTHGDIGRGHGCGVREDGSIQCWGSDNSGQSNPPAGTFTQVAVGNIHSCGLKADGTITCWGSNSYGESTPPAGTFTDVAAGWSNSCGLRADGTAVCWGGRLEAPPAEHFTEITVANSHACGLKIDGSIACWGSTANAGVPDPTEGPFSTLAAEGNKTCAVRADGTAVCWGNQEWTRTYELPGKQYSAVAIPRGIYVSATGCGLHTDGTITCLDDNFALSGRFTHIFASNLQSCGIRTDGTIRCSDHTRTNVESIAVSLLNTPPGQFTQITAGQNHACGLRTDQTVACWGANQYGETGNPPTR